MFGQISKPVIVYVDRNRLQFYGGKLSSIVTLEIPPAIASDIEITNRDGLYALVNQWVKQNAIGGSPLFFVLSPATYFEKVISATADMEQETEILKFYDMVPFEEILTKVISFGPAIVKHAFATNSAFIEALKHAFLLQGLRVVGVIPAMLLGPLSTKRWMDAEMGAYVVKHFSELQGQTVIAGDDLQSLLSNAPANVPTTANNPRLMIMVGIFGILLLVLIAFLFLRH